MGLCQDKSTTYLKRLGYNVVRHPREGIMPLDLIGVQRGSTQHLGRIDQLIRNAPQGLPKVTVDKAAANINGQSSSKLTTAIGVNILGSVLGAMGGGNIDVGAKYGNSRTIQFLFGEVLTDSAVPLDIGNYLKFGDVDADNLILVEYVMGNGRLFVITRTLKTAKLTVKAETKDEVEAKLEVPVIREALDGKVSVSADSETSGTVTYEGTKMLVFGFECFEIGVEGGVLSLMSAKAGSVAMSAATGEVESGEPSILEPNGLLYMDRERPQSKT